MKKVFLGGTCNGSKWRYRIIPMLQIDYFNPVVDDWTPDCQKEELRQRASCDFCLYCITPKMAGVYAIAEVVDDSNKRPEKTVFVILKNDDDKSFSESQWKSLQAVANMVLKNGGAVCNGLESTAILLNKANLKGKCLNCIEKEQF